MAKRRSNGEGTLRLRADGRWEMTIMDGFRDDGKRRFKTFYGKTQKEVKAKAKGYRDAREAGLIVYAYYLFPEWADIWYDHHRDNIAPTTQENYRYTLRILNEGFARRRIADVKPYDIEMFLEKAPPRRTIRFVPRTVPRNALSDLQQSRGQRSDPQEPGTFCRKDAKDRPGAAQGVLHRGGGRHPHGAAAR